MRKGLSNWIIAVIAILLALAIVGAMYLIGTGVLTDVARTLFGQS